MRKAVIAGMVLALGGCSGDKPPDPSTAPAAAAQTAAVTDDSVAAVLQSAGPPVAKLRFKLESAPAVGQPATLRLDISSPTAVPFLLLSADASAGLELDAASVKATLDLSQENVVTRHVLAFSGIEAGLREVHVHLRSAEPDAVETVYAIPVLVIK